MERKMTGDAIMPTLAKIAKDYRETKLVEELHGNWANVVLHRLPSFALVWFCARIGISAMAVSLASAVLAILMPVAAISLPLQTAMIAVCVAGFLFQVLDCTDGALARTMNEVSALGGTVDFLIDMVQWGLLYLALGILADRYLETGGLWSALALLAGWMRLYARMARDALVVESVSAVGTDAGKEGTPADAGGMPGISKLAAIFVAGLSGLIPFLALLMPYPELARASILFLVAYSMLDLIDTGISGLASLRRQGQQDV